MRVIITDEVLTSSDIESWKLHQLIHFACTGRHVVMFENHPRFLEWLNNQEGRLRSNYVDAIEASVRSATRMAANSATVKIKLIEQSQWSDPLSIVSLDDAIELLNEPLEIFVENAINDWHFFLGMLTPSQRDLLRLPLEKGWVKSSHGGGSSLQGLLRERCAIPKKQLRTFAIFDSDRRHPAELNENWRPKNQEKCQGFNAEVVCQQLIPGRYWMLTRRFIESYIPKEELLAAIQEFPNIKTEAIDALFRMPQMSRWHYNMKEGFDADEKPENASRCQQLYKNLSTEDRALLSSGFGPNLGKYYRHSITREFNWDAEAREEARQASPKLMRLL